MPGPTTYRGFRLPPRRRANVRSKSGGGGGVRLPTGLIVRGAGPVASTPHAAYLNVAADLDVRVHAALTDWTPSASSILFGKRNSVGGQRSWIFFVNTSGTLQISSYLDGTLGSHVFGASSVGTGTVDGAARWVRGTVDVDDGGGNRVYRFYTSVDGSTWVPLGNPVTTAGATTIFPSTARLTVGADDNNAGPINGRVFYAELRDGIGGDVLASPHFAGLPPGQTRFRDDAMRRNPWTIESPSAIGAL